MLVVIVPYFSQHLNHFTKPNTQIFLLHRGMTSSVIHSYALQSGT